MGKTVQKPIIPNPYDYAKSGTVVSTGDAAPATDKTSLLATAPPPPGYGSAPGFGSAAGTWDAKTKETDPVSQFDAYLKTREQLSNQVYYTIDDYGAAVGIQNETGYDHEGVKNATGGDPGVYGDVIAGIDAATGDSSVGEDPPVTVKPEEPTKPVGDAAREWAAEQGVDIDAKRAASINAVEGEYERAKATYGAKAEQLAQAGLTGSGYSDNLERDAYAIKQQALAEIEAAYRGDEKEILSAYKAYLEKQETEKDNRVISANATLNSLLFSEDGSSTGTSKNAAILQMVAAGYTEEEAKQAWSNMQNLNFAQMNDTLSASAATGSLDGIYNKAYLDSLVATEQITDENAKALLAKSKEVLSGAITTAIEGESSAGEFLVKMGVKTAEELAELSKEEISDALWDTIDLLYANKYLDEELYNSFCTQEMEDYIKEAGGDAGKLAEAAARINLGEQSGTDAIRDQQLLAVAEALGISKDGIKVETRHHSAPGGRRNASFYELKVGEVTIQGTPTTAPYGIAADARERASKNALVKEGNTIFVKSGGQWYRFTTDDNFVSGSTKLTQEQKDGVFAAIAAVLGGDRDTFRILNSSQKGSEWQNEDGDNGRMVVNGETYYFEMAEHVNTEDMDKINDAFKKQLGRAPQEGDAMVFNGKIVVVTSTGQLRYAKDRIGGGYIKEGLN